MSTHKLVICEKPSQAKSFAAVLNANKRGDGFFEGNGWLISWCYGHLVELAPADAYGEQYKRWAYETLPIIPDVWQYRITADKKKQFGVLRSLIKRADVKSIVCATDAGREGELIFRLVYEQTSCTKTVHRLWISSLEDSAIREGFDKLRPGADFDNLYRAALCRAKADYLVGINATRLFSTLYGLTLNVGRVQSPTLALIVNREAAVNEFISEPFYTPEIDCGGFTASGDKLKDAAEADAVRSAADGLDAVVVSLEKQRKTTAPPKLYDLTTLQRDANRLFGFTAQQTLDYVQSLYEKKLCSYPRTDSRYLTGDMRGTAAAIIEWLRRDMEYKNGPDFSPDIDRLIKDSAVTDHHAIIPTVEAARADITTLPSGECSIFNLIACRLLCAVAPVHVYEATTAILECGGHCFIAKGKAILTDGWKAVDAVFKASLKGKPGTAEDSEDVAALPELAEGQVFSSVAASVKEGKTSPPARYNDATLLSAMEAAGAEDFPDDAERIGIGTPSTRAATIEKLIKTGFVERHKKSLVPTAKAINLIAVLPEDIKSPLLTARWEQQLKLIEKGELADSVFMDGISTLTKGLVAAHSAPVPEYAALFATASVAIVGAAGNKQGDFIGDCPRCKSPVVVKPKGGGRMPDYFCSNRACKFAMWKDNRFFEAKKKKLDKKTATALLNEGRIFFTDLYSEKTGKTYAAAILLEDTGERVNFKLEFSQRGRDS